MDQPSAAVLAAHSRQMILEANALTVREALEHANAMVLTHADIGVMIATLLARSMLGRKDEEIGLFIGACITYARMLADDEALAGLGIAGEGGFGANATVVPAEKTPGMTQAEEIAAEFGVLRGDAHVIRAFPQQPEEPPPAPQSGNGSF